MDIPPSRSRQQSCLSTLSSPLPTSTSPCTSSSLSSSRPLSSNLSVGSENSLASESGINVQPAHLDRLLPRFEAMLSGFDQVHQVTEDVHNLEIKLEEVLARRRRMCWSHNEDKGAKHVVESENPKEMEEKRKEVQSVRCRKIDLLHAHPRVSLPSSFSFTPKSIQPRKRCSFSESELEPFQPQVSCSNRTSDTAKMTSRICALDAADCSGFGSFPRRRAWNSGSSHSADAAQRVPLTLGRECFAMTRPRSEAGIRGLVSTGVPVKRTAWISEGSEAEQERACYSAKKELDQ